MRPPPGVLEVERPAVLVEAEAPQPTLNPPSRSPECRCSHSTQGDKHEEAVVRGGCCVDHDLGPGLARQAGDHGRALSPWWLHRSDCPHLIPKLQDKVGGTFIVDNKAGATGTIGAGAVARSPADGHTLLVTSLGPLVIAPTCWPRCPRRAERL